MGSALLSRAAPGPSAQASGNSTSWSRASRIVRSTGSIATAWLRVATPPYSASRASLPRRFCGGTSAGSMRTGGRAPGCDPQACAGRGWRVRKDSASTPMLSSTRSATRGAVSRIRQDCADLTERIEIRRTCGARPSGSPNPRRRRWERARWVNLPSGSAARRAGAALPPWRSSVRLPTTSRRARRARLDHGSRSKL
jgi:hypothetical protein